jgi:hypothetical protein
MGFGIATKPTWDSPGTATRPGRAGLSRSASAPGGIIGQRVLEQFRPQHGDGAVGRDPDLAGPVLLTQDLDLDYLLSQEDDESLSHATSQHEHVENSLDGRGRTPNGPLDLRGEGQSLRINEFLSPTAMHGAE